MIQTLHSHFPMLLLIWTQYTKEFALEDCNYLSPQEHLENKKNTPG